MSSPAEHESETLSTDNAETLGLSHATPNEVSSSQADHLDQRNSMHPVHRSNSQHSTMSRSHVPSETHSGPSNNKHLSRQKHEDGPRLGKDSEPQKEITVTIRLPCEDREGVGPSQFGAASFQTTAKPEDIRRLLGIPEFQPRDQQPSFTGQRNYNYEEKYPEDKPYEENDPDARFFKVYLDEAEIFDQEKIRSHRDNLDSLLVFAALFSAVVTTFVVQTSQALQPDQSLITNYLLLHQIEILKVISNTTAISGIGSSQYLPDTTTHSLSDVLVNGLFLTSLALSISTALLSVLAKQWLQAYDSSTSGSARDRALVRHLRFMGLMKWKLDEIIGALPLVLHVSVAVFLIGLSVFLWDLYRSLAFIVIVISGISFTLYLASIVIPAIDIECPYRIPLLFRPMRYLVLVLSHFYGAFKRSRRWLWSIVVGSIPIRGLQRYTSRPLPGMLKIKLDFIQAFAGRALKVLQGMTSIAMPSSSLKDAERSAVQNESNIARYLHYSIAWLYEMSSNSSVQQVAVQAFGGPFCDPLIFHNDLPDSLRILCTPRILGTMTEGLFDKDDILPKDQNDGYWWTHPSPWVRGMQQLWVLSSNLPGVPSPHDNLVQGLSRASAMGRVNHIRYILYVVDDADVNTMQPAWGFVDFETPLQAASRCGHPSVIHLLLDKGADVNAEGGYYGSALQAASAWQHLDAVKVLLDRGANVNSEGGGHVSALHVALSVGNLDIVKLLLERGANINSKGGYDGSALQAAASYGHLDTVKILLENGADVNMTGAEFGSALQAASYYGYLEVVRLLLENKADVHASGGRYGSALRAAMREGHTEVVELLRRYEAVE